MVSVMHAIQEFSGAAFAAYVPDEEIGIDQHSVAVFPDPIDVFPNVRRVISILPNAK